MIYLLEPFSKTMLSQLQRGRAIELSKHERNICIPEDFKGSLAALCKRGLVKTKMMVVDGKEVLSVFITQAGKFLLDKEDSKKMGSMYNIM
jgi:hypothetical protein